MITNLSIMNSTGDTKLTWDHANPEEVEQARRTVADLAAQGYSFFLADGTPADAVTASGGTLLVRKLSPEEVVSPFLAAAPLPCDAPETVPDEPAPAPKRRGRPPKAKAQADANVVAVRPLRGG